MTTTTTRKIVVINEELCDGCGACAIKCAESALQIIDGKAKLVSDIYCDGLGACLGECPRGAITIEERAAAAFDEAAVEERIHAQQPGGQHQEAEPETLACGCPSSSVQSFASPGEAPAQPKFQGCPSARLVDLTVEDEDAAEAEEQTGRQPSTLTHWPVQLTLVPPTAPFLKNADILLAAHCAAFAYGDFHRDLLKDHALLIACPKLDDTGAHLEKLTQIMAHSGLKSLTVAHMEVPCCSGLVFLAKKAAQASGKKVPVYEITIGVRGDLQ